MLKKGTLSCTIRADNRNLRIPFGNKFDIIQGRNIAPICITEVLRFKYVHPGIPITGENHFGFHSSTEIKNSRFRWIV
jgi:hypothetical protein